MTDVMCSECGGSCRENGLLFWVTVGEKTLCRKCNAPPVAGLNELRDEIHALAVEKGWWSAKEGDCFNRTPLEIHALIHTEVAEATEEVRNGKPDEYRGPDGKPEGEAVELIDVVVRVLDYFGAKGWDADRIMREKIAFNRTRDFRHGGKTK